jgi:hypothetical protein
MIICHLSVYGKPNPICMQPYPALPTGQIGQRDGSSRRDVPPNKPPLRHQQGYHMKYRYLIQWIICLCFRAASQTPSPPDEDPTFLLHRGALKFFTT